MQQCNLANLRDFILEVVSMISRKKLEEQGFQNFQIEEIFLQNNYSSRLNEFVNGSLVYKNRDGREYCYLNYRGDDGKTKSKYVGLKYSQTVQNHIKSIEKYNYFKKQIKHPKEEEKDMRKMLKSVKEDVNV